MKIIQAKGGTCNQLWIYLNLFSDIIQEKNKIAIWVPDIKFLMFPKLLKANFVSYPLIIRKLTEIIGLEIYLKLLNIFFNNRLTLNLFKLILNSLTDHQFIIYDLAILKKSPYLKKNLETLLMYFDFSDLLKSKYNNLLRTSKNKVLIGVHLRMGDYRQFKNGAYFYEVEHYVKLLKHLLNIFDGHNVKFIIVSDENIDFSKFANFDYIHSYSKSINEDLYLLSNANYIVGPPSTFSAWACLYKNAKIYFIKDNSLDFKKSEFEEIEAIWMK